jgi:hypothetical protein
MIGRSNFQESAMSVVFFNLNYKITFLTGSSSSSFNSELGFWQETIPLIFVSLILNNLVTGLSFTPVKRSSIGSIPSIKWAATRHSQPTEESGTSDYTPNINAEISAQRIDDLVEDVASLITE